MLGLVLLILPILVSGNNTTVLRKSPGDPTLTPGDPTPTPSDPTPTADYTFLNYEHKLKRTLFATDDKGVTIYDVHLRPVNKARDVVPVSASLTIVSIIDLDERSQILSTSGWLKMQWTDIRLKWDPKEYGGVEYINIPAKYLWKPDLMVYNDVEDSLTLDDSMVLAIVYHTGMVLWMPPKRIHTVCSISLHHFPYDTQKCDIEIGSWTYSNTSIQLSVYGGEEDVVDDSHFVEHNAWILKTSKARLKGRKYDCCPDIYQSVVIDLEFRRRSEYYSHVYVTPAVVLSMLIPFIFLMPSYSGEKTILGTGLILGFLIMMVVLESFSMSSMSSAPLIVKYYSSNVVIAAIAMALTHSFALFWRGRWRSPPPKALTCLIVGGVGKLVMVKHHGYAEVEEHPDGEINDTELQTELDNMQNNEHDNSPIVRSSENQLSSTKRAMMDWKLIVMVLDRLFFLIFLTVVIFVTIITIAYAGEPDDVIAEVGVEIK